MVEENIKVYNFLSSLLPLSSSMYSSPFIIPCSLSLNGNITTTLLMLHIAAHYWPIVCLKEHYSRRAHGSRIFFSTITVFTTVELPIWKDGQEQQQFYSRKNSRRMIIIAVDDETFHSTRIYSMHRRQFFSASHRTVHSRHGRVS